MNKNITWKEMVFAWLACILLFITAPAALAEGGRIEITEASRSVQTEVTAVIGFTVTLSPGDGSGDPTEVTVPAMEYKLPSCPTGFTAPDTMGFAGWLVGDDTDPQPAGTTISLSGNVTINAAWAAVVPVAEVTVGSDISYYTTLQAALDAVPAGTTGYTVTLLADIDSGDKASDATRIVDGISVDNSARFPLLVDSGKTVTLDLNGKTIRRVSVSGANGPVIEVSGTLTLTDSSDEGTGTVTGGDSLSLGGGVSINSGGKFIFAAGTISGNTASTGAGVNVAKNSTFEMSGGTISGNTTSAFGGGVSVTGTFTMTGGSIINNNAELGCGGVVVTSSGSFSVGGIVQISGNTLTDSTVSNVSLSTGKKISITGPLSAMENETVEKASIGITMVSPGVFTSGLSGYGDADAFICDHADYSIGLNAESEAILDKAYDLIISDTAHVSIGKENNKAVAGETITLTVDVPEGMVLHSLKVTYVDNENVEHEVDLRATRSATVTRYFDMPAYPVTVTADILTPWASLQAEINAAAAQAGGGTVILTQNVTGSRTAVPRKPAPSPADTTPGTAAPWS